MNSTENAADEWNENMAYLARVENYFGVKIEIFGEVKIISKSPRFFGKILYFPNIILAQKLLQFLLKHFY